MVQPSLPLAIAIIALGQNGEAGAKQAGKGWVGARRGKGQTPDVDKASGMEWREAGCVWGGGGGVCVGGEGGTQSRGEPVIKGARGGSS